MKQIHFIGLYDLFSLKGFMGGKVNEGHSHPQGLANKFFLTNFFSCVKGTKKIEEEVGDDKTNYYHCHHYLL
jgi:hypothetical protein